MADVLRRAILHEPLMLNGKNFGLRLEPDKVTGLSLEFNDKTKMLKVSYGEEYTLIPNAAHVVFGPEKERKVVNITHPSVANASSAQVETPFGHVHAGPGKGKTK